MVLSISGEVWVDDDLVVKAITMFTNSYNFKDYKLFFKILT